MNRLVELALMLLCVVGIFSRLSYASDSVVPAHERIVLKNGVEIYYFKSERVPLFLARAIYSTGSDFDPTHKSGLALLTASLMRKASEQMPEDKLTKALDDMAGTIETSVNEESIVFSASGLLEKAPEILHQFISVLKTPAFPLSTFSRLKKTHTDQIQQLADSPEAMASGVLGLLLFNHTVKARPSYGFLSEFQNVQYEDVKQFYEKQMRIENLRILLVGGGESSRDFLMRSFDVPKDKKKEAVSSQKIDLSKFDFEPDHVIVVNRPGITEAHVSVGEIAPSRDCQEYAELMVGETVLSGHFSSRINLKIRESAGLSYSSNADFQLGKTTGTFVANGATRFDKLAEYIVKLDEILKEFATGEATEEELRLAKSYIEGSFPLSLQTVFSLADAYVGGLNMGLKADFIDRYLGDIRRVSKKSLREAILKHFNYNKLRWVVVGNAQQVKKQLKMAKRKYIVKEANYFL